jgi:hypothetical protein
MMARKFDLRKLRSDAQADLREAINIVTKAAVNPAEYLFARWVGKMTAVHVHAVWERFIEDRAAAALNHDPHYFLKEHDVRGVTNISSGLAYYIVRGGGRYFDFRSMSDLWAKSDQWFNKTTNPFRRVAATDIPYINALSAIRNCVTHGSDAAKKSYKTHLQTCFGIKSVPEPGEFLLAKDLRAASPLRYSPRIFVLINVVERAIGSI